MANVGHARADEDFVDLLTLYRGQQASIVRVVRGAEHRLLDVGQVDFDDFGVFGIGVGRQQFRVGQPGFHGLGATLQGACIAVAFADHPAQQGDVGLQVLGNGFFRQLDGATGSRTFSRSVRELEGLLDGQFVQAFDFKDATGEGVFLALLLDGQQALLDGVVRDGVHQVTQGDARLQLAFEAHQDRLWHVQRHDAGGGSEGYQAGACREGDADREAGVRVTTGTDGVRHQHAVQPAVDDAVPWAQRHAATGADEVWQGMVGGDVDWLRIGRSVAERLHHQVGGEAQASQILEFVTGHGASGVLGTHGGHLRLAVGAWANALAFRQATRTADHLLRQSEALAGIGRLLLFLEQVRWALAKLGTGFFGQAAADDQRDTATGTHFVEQHFGLERERGYQLIAFVTAYFTFERVDVDHVAHGQVGAVELDRQGAGVFHGVVEDRGDLGAEAETASTLVWHVRDIVTEEPQHRVGGGFARRTGTHHVTHVGDRVALGPDCFDLSQRAHRAWLLRLDAVAGHFQHGQGVQRDVRARPGIWGRGQVVGVGFARHLEHGQGVFLGDGRARGEPLAGGPGFQHGLGMSIAGLGFFSHVMEGIEHQQGVLELFGRDGAQFGVIQQRDQRFDVVAALHGAQQFGGVLAIDQRRSGFALGESRKESSLDIGRLIDARRYAVGEQVYEEGFFAGRRVFQQLDQACSLFGVQRLGHDTQRGALFDVFAVGFKHSYFPHQWPL